MEKAQSSVRNFGLEGLAEINHENNICADITLIQSEPLNVWAVNRAALLQ